MKLEHKQLRNKARLTTKNKRKQQNCKVFEIKIDTSHLSKEKKSFLDRLFLEAKWFYNSIIASEDVFKYNDKVKVVTILNKDKIAEDREIKCLTAQMKQSLKDRCIGSIKSLSTKKKKGRLDEVGKLKFKSKVLSIPSKQFGVTYRIENSKYIFIQGLKKHIKVSGLNQIPIEVDFANATLIKKASGYYIKLTCFLPKKEKLKTGKAIGLDFGIKDSIVDSNGNKYNFQFPETKRIKEISRKFNKSKKGTSKRKELYNQLQVAYEKNNNKKKDAKNKIVSKLITENEVVVIQDESIKAWHQSKMKGFGRRIQYSILGGIKSGLKSHPETLVIDKWFPSTKLCPECGALNKTTLADRTYICECGYSQDRDIHSANNILKEGIRILGREPINMLNEEKTSTFKILLNASEYLMTSEANVL